MSERNNKIKGKGKRGQIKNMHERETRKKRITKTVKIKEKEREQELDKKINKNTVNEYKNKKRN